MEPVKAPWAHSDATGTATLPRPAIPGDNQLGKEGMGSTAAPWATGAPSTSGRQLPEMISTAPRMPQTHRPSKFSPAVKRITSKEELHRFLKGDTVKDFVAFILSLSEGVTGKKISEPCEVSPAVSKLASVLDTLSIWVDETPPVEQSLRYGNPAFRTWLAHVQEQAEALLTSVLPEGLHDAVTELAPYFEDSFGNATRIDYGTGHETTFVALLYCLARLGVFTDQDRQALVTVVFKRYLDLMRKVQTTYWLEPAGSHGVWGLDDYQFLPFVWGSAQLISHPMIKPKSIHNPDVLDTYADEYLYLGCIKFIKQVKKGLLSETSPMINDISSVPTWFKVNSGMVKMYHAEVLSKLPIMQHFLFGSLLPF